MNTTAEHGPQLAERDWSRSAIVRLVQDVTTASPYSGLGPIHRRAGRVMTLQQHGLAGEPIDGTVWSTSGDADLTGFVPDEAVQVLQVLEETSPFLATPAEPVHARLARRWRQASALFAHAIADTASADRVMVHAHRQEVTRDVKNQVTHLRYNARPLGPQDAEVLRLAADILDQVVQPGASGYEWDVDSARTAAADLRTLASDPAQAGSDLTARLRAADAALSIALQVDGAVGVDAPRLTPQETEAAEIRFGARLAAVADVE
ncbi:hypothetical protein [Streptosporangium jomthongense]|uniref:Uncharacterized protein n=1 Tax=Streptosporangium jomthongense TaxID=1193683 RepID=A0ABV8FBE1_9ACTN